jgi:excisionase family DNA binding protein
MMWTWGVIAVAEQDKLLTVQEVAEQLRASQETVRRWLRQGRLHGILPGGDRMGYRIRESELRRFIEESGRRGQPEQGGEGNG